ncbi:hypothetical protein HXS70_03600 [Akkermansia muciniphila]|uniref:hypothetical protein n=1 Tax=Akkermansia muciniphila TaxID=239935 RepID=UPI001603ABF5|nr:hypothetical protein [Akkermansia muciniphila]QNB43011.1 hypothetical protein HXS70_03600 [Akkermansia muciniphila]
MRLNGNIYNMSGAKGKSNYAYVGICRPFFNNKTSFVSIPLNIVLYVVLFRLFAKRLKYWGMFRRPASEKGGGGTFGSKPAAKNVPSA